MGAFARDQKAADVAQDHFKRCSEGYASHADSLDDFYNGASCYALMGDTNRAFAMLAHAVEHGLSDPEEPADDSDFSSLHSHPKWKALLRSLK
tara:strand:+ start:29456 stop:29734 length:279 start_codon:yes stop_codon:yes gene_type:complete